MKLSKFITECSEQILIEWDEFAKKEIAAAKGMSDLALRDHAKQILEAAARDIETSQSEAQRDKKSKGLTKNKGGGDSAAKIHGELRQLDGFSLDQLLSEFRALRATVLRLWQKEITDLTDTTSDDMIRFNEAIDQAIAESATAFSEKSAHARDMFLAILGHDLRGPLSTLALAGDCLLIPTASPDQTQKMGARVKRSAATMAAMVNDLLEYARTQLGVAIPVKKIRGDLQLVCEAALDDAKAGHPACPFALETSGNLNAAFDDVRMQQVFTNLLNNAAQYRSDDRPVAMVARGENQAVIVTVCNHGPVIKPKSLERIFDPLVRLSQDDEGNSPPSTSLGLGLFIARQITEAHGGKISVSSSASAGTVFTVCVPRS